MTWVEDVNSLEPGDAIEFHFPARKEWRPGHVVTFTSRSSYWTIRDDETGESHGGLYIEHLRKPGGEDARS